MMAESPILLGATGIETSRVGFGCADLFREPSRSGRRRLLDAAFHAGIRHFDAARMYGLGMVESEIGSFASDKRDRIVIATKFGIEPTPAARAISRVQAPIQRAFRLLASEGARVRPREVDPRSGRVGRLLYRSGDYTARAARASLERSLRALRSDYVDLLLLHDPLPGASPSDDVAEYLESAREAGRIRAWGVAGETLPAIDAARRMATTVPVLQVRGELFSRRSGLVPQGAAHATILFGVIGRATARIVAHLRGNDAVRCRWNAEVGVDCCAAETLAPLLVREAAAANPHGPVLFSTTRPDRIEPAAAAAVATAIDPAVEALRRLIDAELVPMQVQS